MGRGKEVKEDVYEEIEDESGLQELVGYLEDPPSKVAKRLLKRQFFPSKVGGCPAWLIPETLPDPLQELSCERCGKRLRFLLQVYASQGDAKDNCFHRTLFLFVCTNCQPNEVRAFRAQLPRICPYYSSESPDFEAAKTSKSDPRDPELEASCCSSCGIPSGDLPFCEECARRARNGDSSAIFQEREITVAEAETIDEEDEEDPVVTSGGNDDDEDDADAFAAAAAEAAQAVKGIKVSESSSARDAEMISKFKEYQERVSKDPEAALDKIGEKFYEEWCEEKSVKDPVFARFQRFHAENPKHVLRYELGGKPLWFCQHRRYTEDPPKCRRCGKRRIFEFQVQPQLIALLGSTTLADRLDFGTICVYTCEESCEPAPGSPSYIEEFVYVQPEPTVEWIPK